MLAATVFKCILLAKTHVLVLETPIDEYATATISQTFNDVKFEGTVFEGRVNSVSIEYPEYEAKTMSYSTSDYEQRSLSTRLDVKDAHATIDCEIN